MSHVSESLDSEKVKYLRSLSAIRERCDGLFQRALRQESAHFAVHLDNLPAVLDRLVQLIEKDYNNDIKNIPYHSRWRHFNVGGVDRISPLISSWAKEFPLEADGYLSKEITRRLIDLVVVSVLLDAGSGTHWKYLDASSGQEYTRSEGLAVASLHMFTHGVFSSDKTTMQVDSEGLENLSLSDLEKGFQITSENTLLGLSSRCQLLRQLGGALKQHPLYFQHDQQFRPGHLFDFCLLYVSPLFTIQQYFPIPSTPVFPESFIERPPKCEIDIQILWPCLIHGLSSIWPDRLVIDNTPLGDVWQHASTNTEIPFHKLSQWLCYSLLEPLQSAGIRVKHTELLTGLPEYRNGGLFVDMDVLKLKYELSKECLLSPADDLVIEWRALTLCLLDETAKRLREATKQEWPLAKVLEAGTWKLGRLVAREKRPLDGSPPIRIQSDGTVF